MFTVRKEARPGVIYAPFNKSCTFTFTHWPTRERTALVLAASSLKKKKRDARCYEKIVMRERVVECGLRGSRGLIGINRVANKLYVNLLLTAIAYIWSYQT